MAAIDPFLSIDESIRRIQEAHTEELKVVNDQLMAANIELELTRRRLTQSNMDRDQYMRLATKLVTQFGTVEAVFAEAKRMAVEQQEIEVREIAARAAEAAKTNGGGEKAAGT